MFHSWDYSISSKRKKNLHPLFIDSPKMGECARHRIHVIGLIIKIRNWIPVNYHHHHHVLKYKWRKKNETRTVKRDSIEGRWRRKD